jgi:hypothetical protein
MPDVEWAQSRVAAYVQELASFGIELGVERARAMLEERVELRARRSGVDATDTRAVLTEPVIRSWAREAGAQLGDEQPTNPLVADTPGAIVPLAAIGLGRDLLGAVHSRGGDLSGRLSAACALYPMIRLNGLESVRCDAGLLEECADALAALGSPEAAAVAVILRIAVRSSRSGRVRP